MNIKKNSIKSRLLRIDFYLLSSLISAITDIGIFALITTAILTNESPLNTLIATITARVSSSIINFILNFKLVFKGGSKKSIIKYYILWAFQLGLSYGSVAFFGNFLGGNLVIVKAIGDVLLGVLSYQVQYHWVFKSENQNAFFGPFAVFCRWVFRLFTKKYTSRVDVLDEPVIYVCRHLNMHGPYTTLKTISQDMHPMVINVFFDTKKAKKHLLEYTFSQKIGKKPKKHSFIAWFLSLLMCKITKSIKAIPVYRGDSNSISTFKKSMECLLKNESIIVFPDIDYQASYDTVSDIYDGFLYLSVLYKKKTGKSLKFVPLFIDEENRVVKAREFITIEDYKNEVKDAKEYLIREINKK